MGKKLSRWMIAVAVAFGVIVTSTGAIGAAGPQIAPAKATPHGAPSGMHVQIFEPLEGGSDSLIDLGKPGPSAGDTTLSRKPVVDPDTGAAAGTDVTRIQVVELLRRNAVVILDCTSNLTDGAITFYGSFRILDPVVVLAVTGGTGAYAGARGTVKLEATEIGGKAGTLITFEI